MSYRDWSLAETCQMADRAMSEFHTAALVIVAKHQGEKGQAELSYNVTHKHHKKFFLVNLEPLGIDVRRDPPAVVCAKYHYLSNAMGGLGMEYVVESPERAWVRYWPWHLSYAPIYPSTELAGLRAWHAYNGLSLHSIGVRAGLRVGVVCTRLNSLGDPVMELYFQLYDHELKLEERCVLKHQAKAPDSTHYGDAWKKMLAEQGVSWPEERLAKARRNYARYWAADTVKELLALYGVDFGCYLIAEAYKQMAVQHARQWKERLGIPERGVQGVALFMKALGEIQGEEMELLQESPQEYLVQQKSCRLFPELEVPAQTFYALNAFNQASAEMFRWPTTGPRVEVKLVKSMAEDESFFLWQVKEG